MTPLTRRRLAALAVGVALLALAEGVARLVPGPSAAARGIVLVAHPRRIWTLGEPVEERGRPPFYRLTPEGFRRPAVDGPADAPLVLTTGDSSVFGDGIPDGATIHDRLQETLSRRGVPARVGTIAVPGHSTLQTRASLAEAGWDLHPDVLVVGNLWSDSNLDAFRDADLLAAAGAPLARAEALLSGSALFRHLRGAVNGALGRPRARKITWPTPGATGVRRVPLADYARGLEAILDEARARDVGVVVLTLANVPVLREGVRLDQEWAPYFTVQAAVAEARRVPRVMAAPLFRASRLSSEALFRDQLHPTEQGAALLAEGVAAALITAGWPARRPVPAEAPPVTVPADPFGGDDVSTKPSVQRDLLDGR